VRHRTLSLAVLLLGVGLTALGPPAHGQPYPPPPAPPGALPPPPAIGLPGPDERTPGTTSPAVGEGFTVPLPPASPAFAPPPTSSGAATTSPAPVHNPDPVPGSAAEPPPPARMGDPPSASLPGATVFVDIQGPTQVGPGQSWPCILTVRNAGSGRASDVRVELPLPTGLRLLSSNPPARTEAGRLVWDLGDLEVNGVRTLYADVQPGADVREGGEVTLKPRASFALPGLTARVQRPDFEVRVSGPASAPVGGQVVFQIDVTNNGRDPLTEVLVRDELPAGLRHAEGKVIQASLGTLAPGQKKSLTLRVEAREAGRQINRLQARTREGRYAQAQALVLVEGAPLRLALRGPEAGVVGQELEWQLEVSNPGGSPAEEMQVIQKVPEGLAFVAAGADGRHDAGRGEITWKIPALAGKEARTLTFRLRGQRPGEWTLGAELRARDRAPVQASQPLRLAGAALLRMEMQAYERAVTVGEETIYEIRIVNQSGSPTNSVVLAVVAPEGLQVVGVQGPTPGRWDGGRLVFDRLGELPAGVEVVYRLRARGERATVGPLRAEVSAAGLPRPLAKELTVQVKPPARSTSARPFERVREAAPRERSFGPDGGR
jgi:uncharacterized repeat protein (TIGR01451 family)